MQAHVDRNDDESRCPLNFGARLFAMFVARASSARAHTIHSDRDVDLFAGAAQFSTIYCESKWSPRMLPRHEIVEVRYATGCIALLVFYVGLFAYFKYDVF